MAGEAFSEYKFEELPLGKDIQRGLEKLGFELMTPIQAEAIPVLLTGRDVIGQAQTGTGKTAAFSLPILEKIDPKLKKLQAIILCPTRELAVQVANEMRSFAAYMQDVKILPVYGGQDISKQIRGLKGVQIIVGTPGRVMDHMRRHTIKMDHIRFCILDEADEMLKMGFLEDMEIILGAIEQPHQTCLFSATMPQEILDLTDRFQCNPQLIKVTPKELTIDRIKQYYYSVKREFKTQALIRLMAYHHYNKVIVFCNTKTMTDELAEQLRKEGYGAEALHGDLSQKQRDMVMGRFRDGRASVLIATDIAARGIDVDDVEAVFNYDIPQETEYYVHRIGRTGRAGREGFSHTLCKSSEFRKIRDIEHVCHSKMEERRIPSSDVINAAREEKVLAQVLSVMAEGKSGSYVPVVKKFCEDNLITPELLAAAFLKMELGEQVEEIEINLPDNSGYKGKRRDGEHRDGKRRDETRRDGKRSEDAHRDGERRGKKADRQTQTMTSDERKKLKKKNKEVSARELKKAFQEIGMEKKASGKSSKGARSYSQKGKASSRDGKQGQRRR